jgi:hypothetical protein
MDTEVDVSAQVVRCPARTILSVDHLTIHMPARPISTMTEPKAMFMMRSGERTIISQLISFKRLQIVQGYRLAETGLKGQPCGRLESMLEDPSLKKLLDMRVYNCHDTENKRYAMQLRNYACGPPSIRRVLA